MFLVKWLRASHLHNTWEQYSGLLEKGIAGVRKVDNFYRRMETLRLERLRMTEVINRPLGLLSPHSVVHSVGVCIVW